MQNPHHFTEAFPFVDNNTNKSEAEFQSYLNYISSLNLKQKQKLLDEKYTFENIFHFKEGSHNESVYMTSTLRDLLSTLDKKHDADNRFARYRYQITH